MSESAAAAIRTLAERFSAAFPAHANGPRTVGREAEYPIVTATGEAADLRRLWDALLAYGDMEPVYGASAQGRPDMIVSLAGPDFTYALEVGVGTVEVNTRPCRNLFEIEAIMAEAVGRLVRAAARFGWQVLGYGIQPVSPPALNIMAPKQRYFGLYRAMGASWLWYTVTASDQLQVSLTRPEMVEMLNFTNLMTPVLIALCANSPIFHGRLSPFCSAREGRMAEIYANEHRHGMLARPVRDMVDFVASISEATYLIVRGDREIYPSSEPFTAYLAEHGADYDAFLFHEHYIWNSARLRAAYGTVEIRPACQQPWHEHMAVAALGLGLVEGMAAIDAYVQETLGPDYWSIMQTYHQQVIRHGLRAPEPAADFLAHILGLAEAALAGRGLGEAAFFAPLWRRLERRMNPAQQARRVFLSDGLNGLLRTTAIAAAATKPPDG
jgi:gamma-glutamylcysteine synthetase